MVGICNFNSKGEEYLFAKKKCVCVKCRISNDENRFDIPHFTKNKRKKQLIIDMSLSSIYKYDDVLLLNTFWYMFALFQNCKNLNFFYCDKRL